MNFIERVEDDKTKDITTLQLNITKRCNLRCTHCHVEASINRNEEMSIETFDKAMKVYDKFSFKSIDITGGEPLLHKDIEYFIKEATKRSSDVILRSNLVGMKKRRELMKLLKENKVNIVASLPCYTKENVDEMRGNETFCEAIESMKVLNELGYGVDEKLRLILVYNPMGGFLPPSSKDLIDDYRRELEKLGVTFTDLITITNIPMGCFKKKLAIEGELENYENLLESNFNPKTLDSIMCRTQVSVGYDGKIYDCDFNQMEDITCNEYSNLDEALKLVNLDRNIIFRNYCYGCTAGFGSSCKGALNE